MVAATTTAAISMLVVVVVAALLWLLNVSVCVWCLYPRASRPHHSLLCTQLLQKKTALFVRMEPNGFPNFQHEN